MYDVVIIGGVDAWRFDFNAIQGQLDQQPRLRNSLQAVQIESAVDILKTFIGQKSDMESWLETAELNLDRNLRLEYLAGESLDINIRDLIFEEMTADISYPSNLVDLPWQDEYHYKNWFEEKFKIKKD